MKRVAVLLLVFITCTAFCFPPPAGKKKLGRWYKNETLGFKIRTPEDWGFFSINFQTSNLLGRWNGPRLKIKHKELGDISFTSYMQILWFDTLPRDAQKEGECGTSGGNIDEKERKELLKKRSQKYAAHNLKQWLNNYSGLRGVRILEKKECRLCQRPAEKYEFLSKTGADLDYKHYAVMVTISDHEKLGMIFSVIEPEYKKWKTFFVSCTRTLKIDRPDRPSRRTPKTASSKKSENESQTGRSPDGPDFTDLLITHHGKMVEGKVCQEKDFYIITWGQDSVRVPSSLVKKVEFGDPGRFVPETEKEKEFLAKGFIKFKGRWISKYRYGTELQKEDARRKKKFSKLRAHSNPATPWRSKRSRFILETTTNEELLNHYADLMDTLFSVYEKTMGVNVSGQAKKNKPIIRVFKDAREYQNFSKLPGTGGYFSWLDNTLNLYHNFEDPTLSEKTLLHEGTHLLNYLSNTKFKGRPRWVEEGAAEYFGSSQISYDRWGKIKLEPGQILGNRLILVHQKISSKKVENLRDALATKTYKYEDYAYWWSSFHFLITHKKYQKKFLRFFSNLYALRGVEKKSSKAYPNMFSVGPEESVSFLEKSLRIDDWNGLQQEWERFIKDNLSQVGGYGWMVLGRDLYYEGIRAKYGQKSNLSNKQRKEVYEDSLVQSLEALDSAIQDFEYQRADAFYYRSLVHYSIDNPTKALQDLQKANELNPLNAYYHSKQAAIHYTHGDKDLALKDMRIAININPLDVTFPVILEEIKAGTFVDLSRK